MLGSNHTQLPVNGHQSQSWGLTIPNSLYMAYPILEGTYRFIYIYIYILGFAASVLSTSGAILSNRYLFRGTIRYLNSPRPATHTHTHTHTHKHRPNSQICVACLCSEGPTARPWCKSGGWFNLDPATRHPLPNHPTHQKTCFFLSTLWREILFGISVLYFFQIAW